MAERLIERFKRGEFHGRFKANVPKWHIYESGNRWGTLTAICGFSYDDILLDAKVSRAKKQPKQTEMCSKCLARQEAVHG